MDLKKRARAAQMKKFRSRSSKTPRSQRRFLRKTRQKEGVQTTYSGLQYKVLKEGDGISPGPKDSVRVNYRGTFIDGTEFDNSYEKGEPITVQTDRVIKGWTEALQMMKVGSKWQLFVPPELGLRPGRVSREKSHRTSAGL